MVRVAFLTTYDDSMHIAEYFYNIFKKFYVNKLNFEKRCDMVVMHEANHNKTEHMATTLEQAAWLPV